MSKCKWYYKDNDLEDYWETSCDSAFTIIDGTLEDNNIKYCPFCGKEIVSLIEKYDIEKGE